MIADREDEESEEKGIDRHLGDLVAEWRRTKQREKKEEQMSDRQKAVSEKGHCRTCELKPGRQARVGLRGER